MSFPKIRSTLEEMNRFVEEPDLWGDQVTISDFSFKEFMTENSSLRLSYHIQVLCNKQLPQFNLLRLPSSARSAPDIPQVPLKGSATSALWYMLHKRICLLGEKERDR